MALAPSSCRVGLPCQQAPLAGRILTEASTASPVRTKTRIKTCMARQSVTAHSQCKARTCLQQPLQELSPFTAGQRGNRHGLNGFVMQLQPCRGGQREGERQTAVEGGQGAAKSGKQEAGKQTSSSSSGGGGGGSSSSGGGGGGSSSRTPPTAEASPLVKLAWYGSEAFGKIVAAVRGGGGGEEVVVEVEGPIRREEAISALREDYGRSYFVTGEMSMQIYEEDCEFADPFVSFKGRARFKQNVSNLGSFMRDVQLTVLDWQENEDVVTTKWRFSCTLALPWQPILAASGGTDHYFSPNSGRIYKHVERWDISPADGVRQLFKPNPRLRKRSK